MNRFTYKIIKKIREKEYINYIYNHRQEVDRAFFEMVMCPEMAEWFDWSDYHVELYEQIQEHDMSKYDDEEFDAYRKNFFPVNEEEKEINEDDFSKAWKHHYENNRHHWQCRIYDRGENGRLTKEQTLDCLENICDWMAMGYFFKDRPYQFYEKNKDKIKLPQEQIDFIEKVIYEGIDKRYIKRGE